VWGGCGVVVGVWGGGGGGVGLGLGVGLVTCRQASAAGKVGPAQTTVCLVRLAGAGQAMQVGVKPPPWLLAHSRNTRKGLSSSFFAKVGFSRAGAPRNEGAPTLTPAFGSPRTFSAGTWQVWGVGIWFGLGLVWVAQLQALEFGLWSLGFGVWALRLAIWGLGFGTSDLGSGFELTLGLVRGGGGESARQRDKAGPKRPRFCRPPRLAVLEHQLARVAAPHAQLVQLLRRGEALTARRVWGAGRGAGGGGRGARARGREGGSPSFGAAGAARSEALAPKRETLQQWRPRDQRTRLPPAGAPRRARPRRERALAPTFMPFSTMNAVMPCAPFSGAVFAYTTSTLACGRGASSEEGARSRPRRARACVRGSRWARAPREYCPTGPRLRGAFGKHWEAGPNPPRRARAHCRGQTNSLTGPNPKPTTPAPWVRLCTTPCCR
jgi:hypothetical protein